VPLPFTRALVTGASSGIGAAISRRLAAEGIPLVVVARTTAALEALADDLDVDVEVLTADLTDVEDLRRVASRLHRDPTVDLLVNNAGFGSSGAFADLDVAGELSQVRIHCDAVVALTHAALQAAHQRPRTGRRPRAGILNVSSMAGFQPMPGGATYSACKAFMTSFTESVRLENRRHGIHATALCPGFVSTPMLVGEDGSSALPQRVLMDADAVAADGLAGVAANKAIVVPGLAWKVLAAAGDATPRPVTRALVTALGRLRP
jgi:uncharacterized protein